MTPRKHSSVSLCPCAQVVNHLLGLPYAAPRIEDYAVEHLLIGGAVGAPGGAGPKDPTAAEDAAKKGEAQEVLMQEAERLIGLFSALCSKVGGVGLGEGVGLGVGSGFG